MGRHMQRLSKEVKYTINILQILFIIVNATELLKLKYKAVTILI